MNKDHTKLSIDDEPRSEELESRVKKEDASRDDSKEKNPGLGSKKSLAKVNSVSRATVKDSRHIDIGTHDAAATENEKRGYCNNRVRTAKYTWYSLVPVNLFEQFRRIANFYFLLVVLALLVPGVNAVPIWTTAGPLAFILLVSLVKDAIEDRVRQREDAENNNARFHRVHDYALRTVRSANVGVGTILQLEGGQSIPADCVVLTTLNFDGSCQLNTANLDGEVVPRTRLGVFKDQNQEMHSPEALSNIRGTIITQGLRKELDNFEGKLTLYQDGKGSPIEPPIQIPLGDDNLLLRGAKVNPGCDEVYAVVIATGSDTKLMLNRTKAPFKFTTFERTLNRCVIAMLGLQLAINLFMALMSASSSSFESLQRSFGRAFLTDFLVAFILFSYMIPLSLYVTMELVKVAQARFMEADRRMAIEDDSVLAVDGYRHMRAKNSNINDELGQIEYVFSDKTGTLTQNKMQLNRVCVDGFDMVNMDVQDEDFDMEALNSSTIALEAAVNAVFADDDSEIPYETFNSRLSDSWENTRYFLLNLLLNHDLEPKISSSRHLPSHDDEAMYNGSSPDEVAFGEAMHANGVTLVSTSNGRYSFNVKNTGEMHNYTLVGKLKFTSDRRRMDVVMEDANGDLYLFVKGADSTVLEMGARHTQEDASRHERLEDALHRYAQLGSRTLVMGHKKLTKVEATRWRQDYEAACLMVSGREDAIEETFVELEKGLHLSGCTAVDDLLQENVKDAVRSLVEADIIFMILTGDKCETAVSIGYQSGVVSENAELLYLTETKSRSMCEQLLKEYLEVMESKPDQPHALIISGVSMEVCLENHMELFLQVLDKCQTIVCSRATPGNKAAVVKAVKEKRNKVCLAIGDGANDVGMIKIANCGVGVTGKEGTQATQAADFVIHRFFHLKRLLLIHGRYSYLRNTMTVLFSFYKNIVFCFPLLWYGFFSHFSGTSLYDGLLLSCFNVFFTSLPPLILGMFEKDVLSESLERHPKAYGEFRDSKKLTMSRFFIWCFYGILQSLAIYFVAHLLFQSNDVISSDGKVAGFWVMGLWICTSTILIINITFLMNTWNCTMIYIAACAAGFFFYACMVGAYSNMLSMSADFYGVAHYLFHPGASYLYQFATLIVCTIPVALYYLRDRIQASTYAHKLREECELNSTTLEDREAIEEKCKGDHLDEDADRKKSETRRRTLRESLATAQSLQKKSSFKMRAQSSIRRMTRPLSRISVASLRSSHRNDRPRTRNASKQEQSLKTSTGRPRTRNAAKREAQVNE